jgi:hypothetical protein
VSRLSNYLKIANVDPKLLFARGAVLVFVSQLMFLAALVILAVVERWLRLHHPALGPEFGAGRVVWFVLMFGFTLAGMIAQLYGIKLLSRAVRPWTTHSIPAILFIAFAAFGFVLLVGIFTLLMHRVA